jgi:hypothetical protein
MTNNKGNGRGLEKMDMICINMEKTRERVVNNRCIDPVNSCIDPVNSIYETKLEFIDG